MTAGTGLWIRHDDGRLEPEPDANAWAEWFKEANRVIERTELGGGRYVSTVFLGVDYNFGFDDCGPLLFETMIFPECDRWVRYETEKQARAGHKDVVVQEMVKSLRGAAQC